MLGSDAEPGWEPRLGDAATTGASGTAGAAGIVEIVGAKIGFPQRGQNRPPGTNFV